MGRQRTFDIDRAVARATRLFWARGYGATSLRELLRALGIGESSFYHAFGSKRALYRRCLEHYNETVTRRRWEALAGEASVRRGVRRYFEVVLQDLSDPRTPNVCLMAGSLSAEVLKLEELGDYVRTEMTRLEAALAARLEEAKRGGELAASFESRVAAQVLVTFLQGLFRVMRTLVDRAQMQRQVEALLRGLGL